MWNDSNNMMYIQKIESGQVAYTLESLSLKDRANEYILTALRTKEGITLQKLIGELHYPKEKLNEMLPWFVQNGWIEQTSDQISLTTSGKLLADEITLKIFLN